MGLSVLSLIAAECLVSVADIVLSWISFCSQASKLILEGTHVLVEIAFWSSQSSDRSTDVM